MSRSYIDRCADAVEAKMEGVLALLSIGHTRTATAKAMGIRPSQFYDVCARGRSAKKVTERCHKIYCLLLDAEGKAQIRLETIVIEDAKVNVKTAQWLLARRFRLKERHEPDLVILRKLDLNKLDQEEVKLKLLEQKLRLVSEKSADDMDGDAWRALFSEGKEANARLKSLH